MGASAGAANDSLSVNIATRPDSLPAKRHFSGFARREKTTDRKIRGERRKDATMDESAASGFNEAAPLAVTA